LDVSPSNATPLIDVVVKLGGSVLASVEAADAVLEALRAAAQSCRLLVVPGGGPFADVVRDIDRRFGLSDDAAHWMAVLAMDQHAHLLAGRLADAEMVAEPGEIASVIDAHKIPVLAPSRWLRAADPLPHCWDVTSDSIAAWVAGEVGARRLVLIKPRGVHASRAPVDPYFVRALPAGVSSVIVPVDQTDRLPAVFAETVSDPRSRP
jgi:aspartokinase-like uncharacterized kinase